MMVHSAQGRSVPTEGQPIKQPRLDSLQPFSLRFSVWGLPFPNSLNATGAALDGDFAHNKAGGYAVVKMTGSVSSPSRFPFVCRNRFVDRTLSNTERPSCGVLAAVFFYRF
jgi:hypothetical protein